MASTAKDLEETLARAFEGRPPGPHEAFDLLTAADVPPATLLATAAALRNRHFPWITFSRNVFLPLTTLCRWDCGYCTFYKRPGEVGAGYMDLGEVLGTALRAAAVGCKEALFTLGEQPEARHPEARALLATLGYRRTNEYLVEACAAVAKGTGLLPHSNPGVLNTEDLRDLREVNASMGLMLETTNTALLGPGGPHEGCITKHPRPRLATMERAGRLRIPWTTGLLVGIGEGPLDWVQSLRAIAELQRQHGHVQEVIIQPFTPHPGTPMARHSAPDPRTLVRLVATARIMLPPEVSLQAPPNLTPDLCVALLRAGINDWGGISPLTVDYINPRHPWPTEDRLRALTEGEGLRLRERLPIYPRFALDSAFLHGPMEEAVALAADAEGYATGGWP